MTTFKVGDRVKCVDASVGIFNGTEYTVSGIDPVDVTNPSALIWLEGISGPRFVWRFTPAFSTSCIVRCDDASGTDLTQGRFYIVGGVGDGGALVIAGQRSIPLRPSRFSLATQTDWDRQQKSDLAARSDAPFKTGDRISLKDGGSLNMYVEFTVGGMQFSSGAWSGMTIREVAGTVDPNRFRLATKRTPFIRHNGGVGWYIGSGFDYMREDGAWFNQMRNNHGTYFATKAEARASLERFYPSNIGAKIDAAVETASNLMKAMAPKPSLMTVGYGGVDFKTTDNAGIAIQLPVKEHGWNIGINGAETKAPSIQCDPKPEPAKPAPKFKVGDRVRCIDISPHDGILKIGREYVVTKAYKSFGICFLDFEGTNGWSESRFELVPPVVFKKGDRVKCIKPGTFHNIVSGGEYIVEAFHDRPEILSPPGLAGKCITIHGAKNGDKSHYDISRFEIAPPLRAGERVRCINGDNRGLGGFTVGSEYTVSDDQHTGHSGIRLTGEATFWDHDRFVRLTPKASEPSKPNPWKPELKSAPGFSWADPGIDFSFVAMLEPSDS